LQFQTVLFFNSETLLLEESRDFQIRWESGMVPADRLNCMKSYQCDESRLPLHRAIGISLALIAIFSVIAGIIWNNLSVPSGKAIFDDWRKY
jgi:hypothetical protein